MKKFLSILLALAVGFTFTFGSAMSAFAANTTNEFNANVNQAEAQVLAELQTVYNNVVASLTDDTTVSDMQMDKAALKIAAEAAYNKVVKDVQEQTNTIKNGSGNNQDKTVSELVALYSGETKSYSELNTLVVDYTNNKKGIDAAARAQFAVDKAEAIAIVNSVDLTKFSTTEQEIEVDSEEVTTSYRALAEKAVEALIKEIEAVTITDATDLAGVKTQIEAIGKVADTKNTSAGSGILAAVQNIYDADKENVVGYEFTDIYRNNSPENDVKAVLKTADEENLASAQLDANKTAALADVAKKAATFQSAIAALKKADDRTAATEVKNLFVENWTYRISACETESELQDLVGYSGGYTYSKIEAPTTDSYKEAKYADNKQALEALKTYAAKYAAEYDEYGNLVRDAAKIDKVLKAAEVAMYAAGSTEWDGNVTAITSLHKTETDPYKLIEKYCSNDSAVSAYTLENKIATLEATYAGYVEKTTYYGLELKKVREIYDAKIAEYKAAKTVKEFNKIKAVDLTGIDTATTVLGKINALSNYSAQTSKILAYQGVLNAGLDSAKDGYRDFTVPKSTKNKAMNTAAYWTEFYAENDARNASEIEALYAKAVETMEAVPTTKQLKDRKSEVEKMITALPSTVTLADKPAIKAAWEAAEAYEKEKGSNDITNYATLLLDIKSVEELEKKDIKNAFSALKLTTANVTVADKAAVEKVVAQYDEYTADWDVTEGMYYDNATSQYTEALLGAADDGSTGAASETSLLGKIRSLEAAAVNNAINAIPLNVELKDKATIEAARAAYDEYVKNYSYTYDVEKTPRSYDAASKDFNRTTIKALEDAETAINLLEEAAKWTDSDAKAYANDLAHLKVNGKKLSNGKVKFTLGEKTAAKVSTFTENGYTVKYSFYKADSKNGTYSLMKTKDTAEIIPTKGVKGKTYYFKVVLKVYDANGELVARTYLGQADYGYAKWTAKTVK